MLAALASTGGLMRLHAATTATTILTVGVAECSDGIDNDGDLLIDFPADPDCSSVVDDDESTPSSGTPPGGGSSWYGPLPGGPTGMTTSVPGIGIGIFPPPPPQQELPSKILRICDFSGDNRCNIVDLSILLYWAEQPMPQAARYDLNNDGVIDVVDISVLFYYWG
jgi:hypothetical protein